MRGSQERGGPCKVHAVKPLLPFPAPLFPAPFLFPLIFCRLFLKSSDEIDQCGDSSANKHWLALTIIKYDNKANPFGEEGQPKGRGQQQEARPSPVGGSIGHHRNAQGHASARCSSRPVRLPVHPARRTGATCRPHTWLESRVVFGAVHGGAEKCFISLPSCVWPSCPSCVARGPHPAASRRRATTRPCGTSNCSYACSRWL